MYSSRDESVEVNDLDHIPRSSRWAVVCFEERMSNKHEYDQGFIGRCLSTRWSRSPIWIGVGRPPTWGRRGEAQCRATLRLRAPRAPRFGGVEGAGSRLSRVGGGAQVRLGGVGRAADSTDSVESDESSRKPGKSADLVKSGAGATSCRNGKHVEDKRVMK